MFPNERTSAEKAAYLGSMYVHLPALIIMILPFTIVFFLPLILGIPQPDTGLLLSWFISIFAGWLWWAIVVVKWKCWAVKMVVDFEALTSATEKRNMPHGGLSAIGRFEIASPSTRSWYQNEYRKRQLQK